MEKLDEEIAFSMLRIGYRPKDIVGVIQKRSPHAQVFIKQMNRGSYARKVLLSAQREISQAKCAR